MLLGSTGTCPRNTALAGESFDHTQIAGLSGIRRQFVRFPSARRVAIRPQMAATGRGDCRSALNLMEKIMQTFFGQSVRDSLVGSSRRAALSAALLCAAAAVVATPAQALVCDSFDMDNTFVLPGTNATGFEIDFSGDLTAEIPSPPVTTDQSTNPFYALNVFNASPYNQTTITYDATNNLTRYVMSGTQLPNTVPAGWPVISPPVNGVGTYHVGIVTNYCPGSPPVAQYWLGQTNVLPGPAAPTWAGVLTGKGKLEWANFFVEVSNAGQTVGTWNFTPYQPSKKGGAVKFEIANNTKAPFTLGLMGYQLGFAAPVISKKCSKDPLICGGLEKYLDMLNPTDFPMPDQPGSKYVVIPPPKQPVLQPGQKYIFVAE